MRRLVKSSLNVGLCHATFLWILMEFFYNADVSKHCEW